MTNTCQYQYSNKFGNFRSEFSDAIWIGEVKYSDKLLEHYKNHQQEMMKVGDLIIDGLLRTKPFCVKDFLIKDDWLDGPKFFENIEILNGYSPAHFCLNDHRLYKNKLMSRF
jgi:hypothetical protein